MKDNARNIACEVLYKPRDARFGEEIRLFQGCPTLAVTRGGRIYLGWYSGGTKEPHMENYNLLVYSDDEGESWSEPLIVIPSSKPLFIHALDIQLWCDPSGRLHVAWVQNNTEWEPETVPEVKEGQPLAIVDGYMFGDFEHAWWEIVCDEPDADEPRFSAPRYIDKGFLRCKPLFTSDGAWLAFNYDQNSDGYGYSISRDNGETFEHRYGAKKLETLFDEAMAYEMLDGRIRMLARSSLGELAESYSYDGGESFSEAKLSGIDSPSSRFYISRTPLGRILLILNDDRRERKNMTLCLSEDDGLTWKHKLCIDGRISLSYPDADFYGDKIYFTYDRERTGAGEILFACLTEEDIINGRMPQIRAVSKKHINKGHSV